MSLSGVNIQDSLLVVTPPIVGVNIADPRVQPVLDNAGFSHDDLINLVVYAIDSVTSEKLDNVTFEITNSSFVNSLNTKNELLLNVRGADTFDINVSRAGIESQVVSVSFSSFFDVQKIVVALVQLPSLFACNIEIIGTDGANLGKIISSEDVIIRSTFTNNASLDQADYENILEIFSPNGNIFSPVQYQSNFVSSNAVTLVYESLIPAGTITDNYIIESRINRIDGNISTV